MNSEKLFKTLVGSYHDGALIDAQFNNGTLCVYCFRNPADFENKEDPNTRYVIIRFDNVTDLQFYNYNNREYRPYQKGDFDKKDNCFAICEIDYLDYEDGYVTFGQCIRFLCDNVTLLASSIEEIDFSKFVK